MPKKCCVLGCKSNHKAGDPYINSFLFPRDEDMRKKWLVQISREDYTIKKSSVVCIQHFTEDMIVKKDTISKDNGDDPPIQRTRLGLKPGAFPTIVTIPSNYTPPVRKKKSLEQANGSVTANGTSSPSSSKTCDYCNFSATNLKDLEAHVAVHSDSKPYNCPYCEFKALLRSQMYSHLTQHANEKPFKCKYCDCRTLSNTDMSTHLKTHTGEKSL